MVSAPHEAMHRIFQQHPGVFVRAARAIGIPFDDPVSSSPPTDLTQSPLGQELRAEGKAEGEAKGLAEGLLLVLAGRGIDIHDEARARITSCEDRDTLSTWLARAGTATSTDDIFEDE
ncbi:hypothetical protein ABZV31_27690 [Streptomyces sp. NPDC005202]|uniref:hypothetical protein n=1 Tax=Streptomyces sp. NPDC005202 TaxID=3157021 RepID=UPI0033A15E7F